MILSIIAFSLLLGVLEVFLRKEASFFYLKENTRVAVWQKNLK